MEQKNSAIEIFCCYAHEDKVLLDVLKTHLSAFKRLSEIKLWDDGDISAGAEWGPEIKKHLNNAKIILLLISRFFIDSDYCYGTEMRQALERHKQGEARVIPIILSHISGWERVPPGDIHLGDLQALPKDAKPVTTWRNRDEAWEDVIEGIERVANQLLGKSSSQSPIVDKRSERAIQKILAHCYRRAIFTETNRELGGWKLMIKSLAACRVALQKEIIYVRQTEAQQLVRDIIEEIDFIERLYYENIPYHHNIDYKVDSAKVRIINSVVTLSKTIDIPFSLPTSMIWDHHWHPTDKTMKEPPKGRISPEYERILEKWAKEEIDERFKNFLNRWINRTRE